MLAGSCRLGGARRSFDPVEYYDTAFPVTNGSNVGSGPEGTDSNPGRAG